MDPAYLGGSGPLIAFAMVLAGSVGLPIPTLAGLILLGSMAGHQAEGVRQLTPLFAAALAGAALGDAILFALGRRLGSRMLGVVCRLSLSPDACVRQTSDFFGRRGPALFLIARWIPGLSTLSAPFAGAAGIALPRFLGFAVAGAALWIAVGLGLGAMLAAQIAALLHNAERAGLELGAVGTLLVLGYVAFSWTRRRLFARKLRMARIAPDELLALLEGLPSPLIVDERSAPERLADPFRIPGAICAEQVRHHFTHTRPPLDTPIVIYCACPNEASAAIAALELRKLGYRDVRPLRGGLDAWRNAGLRVERLVAPPETAPAMPNQAPRLAEAGAADSLSRRSGAAV